MDRPAVTFVGSDAAASCRYVAEKKTSLIFSAVK